MSIHISVKKIHTTVLLTSEESEKHHEGKVNILSKLKNIYNHFCSPFRKRSYRTCEIYVSSPVKGCVPATVFHKIPESLMPYVEDGMINVDKNYFLKNKISFISSVDCSATGTALPENKDSTPELCSSDFMRKEYQRQNWDYTSLSAWD